MAEIDDEYLRENEAPMCIRDLLGSETTLRSAHVADSLRKLEGAFSRHRENRNAAEVERLCRLALQKM